MKMTKHILAGLLALLLLVTVGCSGKNDGVISNQSKPKQDAESESSEPVTSEQLEAAKKFKKSTPENDTDVGLKNIKIDNADLSLTDEQRTVLKYFDEDYLNYPTYEALRRYPVVFEGAQLHLWGSVKKVLSLSKDSIEMVFWVNASSYEIGHGIAEPGAYVLLSGKVGNVSYMEEDVLEVYGRYVGIETIEVDGVSYTIPKINMYQAYITDGMPGHAPHTTPKSDLSTIKSVATAIFGDDIEIRNPVLGVDITGDRALMLEHLMAQWGQEIPYLLVELEDQSNAKFSKYLFNTSMGDITPLKDGSDESVIERKFEFAADFSHYFLFTFNTELETLTLEYYDHDLNKIWKREFEETTNANYDYTKNNIYLTANNELYIINIETGEDTFAPTYVGPKKGIRKLDDGILLVSESSQMVS